MIAIAKLEDQERDEINLIGTDPLQKDLALTVFDKTSYRNLATKLRVVSFCCYPCF